MYIIYMYMYMWLVHIYMWLVHTCKGVALALSVEQQNMSFLLSLWGNREGRVRGGYVVKVWFHAIF